MSESNDDTPASLGTATREEDILLANSLKPEEISGEQKEARAAELVHWFRRYYAGNANPKWLVQHAAELAYYVANLKGL